MNNINYNHLYYFWEVARQGSLSKAADALYLTPQTVSGQLKVFQENFPEPLFVKMGRRLNLTHLGERVFDAAEAMFANNEQLAHMMNPRGVMARRRLRVGAADSLPKLTVRKILEPIFELPTKPILSVAEIRLEDLLDDLAFRRLDAVISDRPAAMAGNVRLLSEPVLSTGVSIFAGGELKNLDKKPFPTCLDGAPAILPPVTSYVRGLLDQWFYSHDIHPDVVAEMEDSALIKAFGQKGFGFFAAPSEQADVICSQYNVENLGACAGIKEQFFVVTVENAPKNPVVLSWLNELKMAKNTGETHSEGNNTKDLKT